MDTTPTSVESAQVVLPCSEPLSTHINWFTALGFKVRTIVPADHPRMAVLLGHGLTLRLEVGSDAPPPRLRLLTTGGHDHSVTAPNGTVVEFVDAHPALHVPALQEEFVVSRMAGDEAFGEGRAGMRYRDLIPGRLGGRFIASHILIPDGGPVGDYVHYHNIRFQIIYCFRGWVKVDYEDQGELLLLEEGDCFLQPAMIRHRVREASDRMQVIEICCPAEHETWGDPEITWPTGRHLPDRGYGPEGHRFVHHKARTATWQPWRVPGYEARDTGIGAATDGLGAVRVARPLPGVAAATTSHQAEFVFHFVLDGAVTFQREHDAPMRLGEGDSVVVPAHTAYTLSEPTADFQLLDITLPADVPS